MTKLEAWKAWCATAGTERLADQFTLDNSSHGKAFSFAWDAAHEACAEKTGEFARKWWSIHCASNKHMETTRKAHDDFCALQAAIRARSNT